MLMNNECCAIAATPLVLRLQTDRNKHDINAQVKLDYRYRAHGTQVTRYLLQSTGDYWRQLPIPITDNYFSSRGGSI